MILDESMAQQQMIDLVKMVILCDFPWFFGVFTTGFPQDRAKRFMACLDAARQRQLRLLASLEAEPMETGAMAGVQRGFYHGGFYHETMGVPQTIGKP